MCEIKREEKRERAVKVMSEKRVKQQRESKTRKRYMWNEERGGKVERSESESKKDDRQGYERGKFVITVILLLKLFLSF